MKAVGRACEEPAFVYGFFCFVNRAFVEFSRNPKEVFKVLPEVYLAIKMSQLKIPFELCVHYPEDITRQVQGAAAAGLEFLR